MGPVPVPVMLPLRQLRLNLRIFRINRVPEFLPISAVRPLDLAVQTGRSGRDRPKLDRPIYQSLLNRLGEEFTTAIGLDALDQERHLLDESLQKGIRRKLFV